MILPLATIHRLNEARAKRQNKRMIPSPELLKSLLDYDPATGRLRWRAAPAVEHFTTDGVTAEQKQKSFVTRFVGKPAFNAPCVNGYRKGGVFGKEYFAHRVVWAIHTGSWPLGEIDHINGDRSDNRIENLRDVDRTANTRNSKIPCTNTSGVMGVAWCPRERKWVASIKTGGRRYGLGQYSNIEDAIKARRAAERRFGFHQNHGRAA